MISAVAPPGMPIERGMTASWIQRLVNLGSGNMNVLKEGRSIVAHWSWMRCAAALGIIPGETYREPQVTRV
jgi:hypothetical protein